MNAPASVLTRVESPLGKSTLGVVIADAQYVATQPANSQHPPLNRIVAPAP